MSKQRNKAGVRGVAAKRLVVLLITLALLTVPIALYFTVYISSRTSYLTNRDFRQLASVSVQLEERIGLLKDLFVKAVKQTIADTNKPQAGLEAFQQHLGNKKTLAADTAPELKEPLSAGIAKRITDGLESRVVMEVVTAGESSTIYFALPGSPELPRGFRAKAELEEIVTPLIGKHTLESRKGSEHEEGFDALVIASLEQKKAKDQQQTAGFRSSIIFQQGSSDLDVDSLDNLANANVPDKTIDVRTLSENSTLADVQLAGTTYKIYSQPITIAVKTATPVTANSSSEKEANVGEKSETNWVVCGLVQDSHFRHEAWAFPYTWFILFVFASVVIILSWPFVKLQFIGPKDRLRLADFYWLGFSLLVGGAMLTFFLLYGVSYLRTDALLDQQLEQTSSDINARFQDEVALILKQVDNLKAQGHNDFQSIHEGESRVISPDTGDARIGPTQLGDDRYPNVTKADILRDDKLKAYVENGVYPYFRRAAWINKQGDARLEWTISPGPTLVDVTDRDFLESSLKAGPGITQLTTNRSRRELVERVSGWSRSPHD